MMNTMSAANTDDAIPVGIEAVLDPDAALGNYNRASFCNFEDG
jgi:hypothetical protein